MKNAKNKDYLCVYGTLMHGLKSSKTDLLREWGQFVGETWIPGRLYDLGYYPGLVYEEGTSSRVRGHVFELYDPQRVLPILDGYEGINPSAPQQGPYIRISIGLKVGEQTISSWIYPYIWPVDRFNLIASGDYLAFLPTSAAHQQFISSV